MAESEVFNKALKLTQIENLKLTDIEEIFATKLTESDYKGVILLGKRRTFTGTVEDSLSQISSIEVDCFEQNPSEWGNISLILHQDLNKRIQELIDTEKYESSFEMNSETLDAIMIFHVGKHEIMFVTKEDEKYPSTVIVSIKR
ncbi:hypothetical protein ONV78_28995 [Hahella sp. CR1]|uniref:hypothetical protein n=1 Tax=Hahella sp. CR1 TaxID=2992807 RepID=UPI0024420E87|nr:hypothetical protein [Hahella sp. CR1]MDG9671808.1 hypothetical protein [Hahella sp. CR1]